MIILDCEQLSEEWFSARCGIPSASNFDKIVTSKGEPSKQQEKYLFQLAGERLLGKKEEGFSNYNMQRGIELEPEARSLYELHKDKEVEQVGLVYLDERKRFSCSPDGLGLEIKCPSLAVHVGYLLKGKLPTEYKQQVQGCMYVTGYKAWDFLSYYPGVKPLLLTIKRDYEFINKLALELELFCNKLDIIAEELNGKA